MLTNIGLRAVLKSSAAILREASARCSAVSIKPWTGSSALLSGPTENRAMTSFTTVPVVSISGLGDAFSVLAVLPPIRHYARTAKNKKADLESQLSDLPPTMLKKEYAAVPLAQTTEDIVKRLISLELANNAEKLQLKKEQMIAKVQREESDRDSVEVHVALLTAKIRNLREHMQKHHKDKSNKRRMLMAIDQRKKILKKFRLVHYDAFTKVCEQLGITYTFPPEYYRRATRRWLAKKEFCIKVFKAVQKKKAEQRLQMKQSSASTTKAAETQ